jgi:hypothetical protein
MGLRMQTMKSRCRHRLRNRQKDLKTLKTPEKEYPGQNPLPVVDLKTLQTLQKLTDMTILELLASDGFFSKKVASTGGGEYAGPCPFCGRSHGV